MRLILIRHGQTPSNVAGLLDTAVPGPGLTELGEQQAKAVAEALAGEPVERVIASTATRAQLTAGPLAAARGLELGVIDGLQELAAGDLEMAGDHESVHTYLHAIAEWSTGNRSLRMPGGETGSEVLARYDAAIEAAVRDGGTVAVVSHGAVIRFWASARAQNIPDDFGLTRPVSNTGVVVLERDSGGPWQLVAWEGQPVGGPAVADPDHDGPAADVD